MRSPVTISTIVWSIIYSLVMLRKVASLVILSVDCFQAFFLLGKWRSCYRNVYLWFVYKWISERRWLQCDWSHFFYVRFVAFMFRSCARFTYTNFVFFLVCCLYAVPFRFSVSSSHFNGVRLLAVLFLKIISIHMIKTLHTVVCAVLLTLHFMTLSAC